MPEGYKIIVLKDGSKALLKDRSDKDIRERVINNGNCILNIENEQINQKIISSDLTLTFDRPELVGITYFDKEEKKEAVLFV